MLKRDITYEDFNGETITEPFYFNLTKTEIIELEVNYEGGLEAVIKQIVASNNSKALLAEFKKIVLLSYGIKSDDGKRFMKSDQIREEFSQSAAYDALFMDLATNEESAANFIKGILPKDLSPEMTRLEAAQEVPLPPNPPSES